MSPKQFREALGIALEMRSSGKIDVLVTTPLLVAGVREGVTIVGTSTQIQVPHVQ